MLFYKLAQTRFQKEKILFFDDSSQDTINCWWFDSNEIEF